MKTLILSGVALLLATLTFGQTKSEVFVELADRGRFTVYLDDEFAGSSKGQFRFYDVYTATPTLSVMQGNTVLFKRRVTIKPGTRTIFRYAARGGFMLVKEIEIFRNRQYALNDWDDYAGAYNTGIVPPRQHTPGMSPAAFEDLLGLVKKESFDEGKIKLITAAFRSAPYTTAQLKSLLPTLRFDDNKLVIAKSAYVNCVDKENYFTLVDAFTFKSNKDALLDFISKN